MHRFAFAAVLISVSCFALAAHASALLLLAQAEPSPVEKVLQVLFSPLALELALGALGLALGFSGMGAVRKRRVAMVVGQAFFAVEEWKREFPGSSGLQKVSQGLSLADEYMRANGWRGLTAQEQQRAALSFKALHGQQEAQAETLARAQIAAAAEAGTAGAVPTPPLAG